MNTNSAASLKYAPSSESAPASQPEAPKYVLGHSSEELKRLENQGMFLRPSTRDFLQRVGITAGMRVLDVGCGTGDVSFLAAELVGPTGEVVAFDRAEAAISVANARAQVKGIENVRFVQCDIDGASELAAERPFDAVVGRLVMIHQKNPRDALRKLFSMVRPGGLVGFQEVDYDIPYWSTTTLPLMDELCALVRQFTSRGMLGGNLAAAFSTAFAEAGVTERRIIRSGAVESASDANVYPWLTEIAQVCLKLASAIGLPAPKFGPDFGQALKQDVARKGASFIPFSWLGAAGRLPHLRSVH